MQVPDYKSANLEIDSSSTPRVRLLGIESTLDHSSEQSVNGWNHALDDSIDLFNRSGMAERLKVNFMIRDFLHILKGMNGDHAANEKSSAKEMQGRKHTSVTPLGRPT